ncbi:MAG: type II toxin-antitoxin system Phd/YefM family antitoxin [Thermoanaerobaculia bacterium]
MKVAGVAELKARLSLYLASVKEGEEVTVTDRGKPIARLVPLDPTARGHRRLQELARLGLVRLPRRTVTPEEILDRPRPDDPEGRSLHALLEERETGW